MSASWDPTPSQQGVVEAHKGPHRVVAGPGSGKTTTLIERIAAMLDQGVAAEQILALTFSRKAAEAIRNKVRRRVQRDIAVYTYHAFAANLLDEYGERRLTLLSGADGWRILDTLAREHPLRGFDETQAPKMAMIALSFIERMQQELLLPEDVRRYLAGSPACPPSRDATEWAQRLERLATLADLYERYQRQKRGDPAKDEGKVDFGDQVMEAVRLLWTDAEARQELRRRYPYLLLDEYQDTNFAQGVLVALLIGEAAHVLAVGDEDQSIYGFQGATQENILRFEDLKTLGDNAVMKHTLAENFRSLPDIVDLARDFVGAVKPLRATRVGAPGAKAVTLAETLSVAHQAEYVVQAILRRREDDGRAWKDFAILSANKVAFGPVRQALRAAGVPFQVVGRSGLLEQAEARDVLAYARLVEEPAGGPALARVLRRPPLSLSHASIRAILARPPGDRAAPLARSVDLPPLAAARVGELREWLAATRSRAAYEGIRWTVKQILEFTGHQRRIETGRADDPEATRAVLHRLLDLAEEMDRARGSLADWLTYLRLLAERGEEPTGEEPAESDTVKMLTIHAAKGLEWPVVFLISALGLPRAPREETAYLRRDPRTLNWDGIGAGDWNCPSAVAADLERLTLLEKPAFEAVEPEERRLTYVGMTRAADELILTCPSGTAKPNDTPRGSTRLLEYVKRTGEMRVRRSERLARAYVGELLRGYLKDRYRFTLLLLDDTQAELNKPPASLAARQLTGAQLRALLATVDAGDMPELEPSVVGALNRLNTSEPLSPVSQSAGTVSTEALAVFAVCPRQYAYRYESRLAEDAAVKQRREQWEALRRTMSEVDGAGRDDTFEEREALLLRAALDAAPELALGQPADLIWRLPPGGVTVTVDRLALTASGAVAALFTPDTPLSQWPDHLAIRAAVCRGALLQYGWRASHIGVYAVSPAGVALAPVASDEEAAALDRARLQLLLRQRAGAARTARVGPACAACGFTMYCRAYRDSQGADVREPA